MTKKGFSLLEILVSTTILALVVTGLISIFITGKRYILHSRSRMTGGELGRYFLDPLQMYVRQDTWDTNCLGTGNAAGCTPSLPASIGTTQGLDRDYTVTYSITKNSPITNINKVKVNINWAE